MAVQKVFSWSWINPSQTVSVFVHGFSQSQAVVFSVTPFVIVANPAQFPDVFLSQGRANVHVDGTIGRTAVVTNNGFQPCAASLLALIE